MSRWTHITACLSVDTNIEDKHIKRVVRKYLRKAPKITGSEGNVDIFINIQSGHNVWMSADCEHCPYGNTRKRLKKGGFVCTHPVDYECQEGEYQTNVTISVQGDLRDRIKKQTQEEFDNFLKYIEKEYEIRDYSVNIEGDEF